MLQAVGICRVLIGEHMNSLGAVSYTHLDVYKRQALRQSLGDATVILISHRVTTLMQADRILVLEGGRVADLGSHGELISRPGIYKDIYDIQMSSDDRRLLAEGGHA